MKYLPILLLLVGCTWENKSTPYQQAIQQHPLFNGTGFALTQDGYVVLPQTLLTQEEHDELVALAKRKGYGDVVGVSSIYMKGVNLRIFFSVRQGPALNQVPLDATLPSTKVMDEYQAIWIARGHKAQAAKAENRLPSLD